MFCEHKLPMNLLKMQVLIQGNRFARVYIISKLPNDAKVAIRWTTLKPRVHLGCYYYTQLRNYRICEW